MESIRILVPSHVSPNIKSVVTLFIESILPVLKQHV